MGVEMQRRDQVRVFESIGTDLWFARPEAVKPWPLEPNGRSSTRFLLVRRGQYAHDMKPGERLAVVDLGSNSFRLVVFMAGDGWWRRTDEIYEPVRIGEGLAGSGELGEAPGARALATLEVFAHFCRASGLDERHVDAVATSAIREARNAEAFLVPARAPSPARSGCSRASRRPTTPTWRRSTPRRWTQGCVLDLGGGSLQLLRVEDRLPRQCGSWRVGTVLMSERYLPVNGPPKRKQLDELRRHIGQELSEARWLKRLGRDGGRLVGLGGTVRNLAAAAQRAAGLPSSGVQGMVIERSALAELIERLAELPARERASVPGIKPARADLILAGAIVVQNVLEAGGFESLEVTEAGLREGVFFERLLGGTPGETGAHRCSRTSAARACSTWPTSTPSTRPTPSTWRRWRWGCSTSWPRSACTTARPASGNCCGRPACSTTSACRSTTTTTTSTPAT